MSDTAMSRPRCRAAACRPLRPRLSRRPKATEPFLLVIRKFRAVVRDIIPRGRRCEDRLAIRLRGLFCRLAVVKRAAAPWMSKKTRQRQRGVGV